MNVRSLVAVVLATSALAASLPQVALAGPSTVNSYARGHDADADFYVRGEDSEVDATLEGSHSRQSVEVLGNGIGVELDQLGDGSSFNGRFVGNDYKIIVAVPRLADDTPVVFGPRSRAINVMPIRPRS